jgi:tetratricopeptide (TPR) repeat protein
MRALEDASEREQIFDLLLRAARSRTRFAALLSVHAEHLRGRRALADDGLDPAPAGAVQLPRNTVPALEAAIASAAPAVAPLATGEPFLDGLIEQLGGAAPAALILPIAIGRRTVALVVAHRGEAPLAEGDVADLFPLVAASGAALARTLAARSRAATPTTPPRPEARTRAPSAGYEIEVSIEPPAPPAREALAELRRREAWEELAEAIRERVREGMEGGEPDEDEQLDLLLELGRVEAERLGRPERAIEALRGAQTIDAGDARVLDPLETLLVRQGRWGECVDLLEKRAALTEEPRTRIAMLANLAAIARERLGDDDRAAAAYERILAREPGHEVASRELAEIHAARQDWQPLVALLLDRATREDGGGVATLEQVAHLYEDKLGDASAAFLVWLTVSRRDPDRPHLIEQLDRLAVRAAGRAGPEAGAWDEVVAEAGALAAELEAAHPEAAAGVWNLIGRWHRDHTANRDAAVHALERALRANPDDLDALTELPELLRADGRWLDLIALLARRAEAAQLPARKSELHAELGELYETQLAQPDQAIACYERALDGAPDPAPILVELHRLYLATEAWEALAELSPRLIEALAPSAPRAVLVDLHVELGAILAERLRRPDDAVRAYRDALALDPKHAPAHRGLAAVYEATGQADELLDATEAELDAAPRAERLQRYGDLAAAWHELARPGRAAACWQKLLALEPRSVTARRGLARALRATEQWPALAAAQRALLELVTEPAERIELSLELAAVLEDRFDDTAGAAAAYQEVVELDPDHRGALHALARLHERAGRIQPALAALQRLLELTAADLGDRADLLQRIGHVHLGARDAANARISFAQAIALDRDSAPAHEGMARVHIQQGELVAAGEQLVRAAQLAASPDDTLRWLADAAWLYRHRLGDAERARACLHRVLELDPEHADARAALAELLAETRQWEDLWPHLEQEVARARDDAAMPAQERLELYARAARCAVELGRFPTALELYDAACALEDRPALQLERADALFRSTALEAAAAAYQAIALQHAQAQALDRAQLVGIHRRLAQIHTALGKPAQAQAFHGKVLDLDPRHRETLEDLIELSLARGRHDEAIASLRSLAASLPPAERLPILERIGDLYRDKLANLARATSTYLEALELDEGNHRILQRLLDLQTDAGQWKAAVETIDRFLAHEADPARRGSYFLASAEIRRSELRDKAGAIACYDAALDELLRDEPPGAAARARALDAFRALHELLTAEQSWNHLEQAYRRMIKRLPKGDPALVQLWHALGEIHRTALDHPQTAIEAFEIAHSIDPDRSPQRARLLAELYAQTGAHRPAETSGRAAKLVGLDPTNPDAYRALGRTSLEAGRIDEAWCVSRALVFLDQATPEEAALYRRHKAHEARKATGILDEDAWAYVRHPDEERVISAIFALIWEAAVALRAGPPKTFELKPKERMPVEEGTGVIAKIFRHAARVLGVPLPDVYVQPRRSGRLLLANCVEKGRLAPTIIVGRDLMTGYRDTEIAASVGAMLALLRPAYYLKVALGGVDELEAALAAAARLVGQQAGRAELEPLASAFLPELQKRATRPVTEALAALVSRLPEPLDVARWRAAVDAAAQRAGLLVSGELAAAARMLPGDAALLGGARPGQRAADLVGYSVSPSYFAIRRHLGVAVA